MRGVQGTLFVPGSHKVALPRTRNGIGVFSMGSLIPESEALDFESAARGESHTWRATREFALLGEILRSFECEGAPSDLGIRCLGTVPFDPELARHCDLGSSFESLRETPVGRALEQIAQRLLDGLDSTMPAAAQGSRELRPDREPSR